MSRLTSRSFLGGAERDRTVGLLNAIQALSQLSYSPTRHIKDNFQFNIEQEKLSIHSAFCPLNLNRHFI